MIIIATEALADLFRPGFCTERDQSSKMYIFHIISHHKSNGDKKITVNHSRMGNFGFSLNPFLELLVFWMQHVYFNGKFGKIYTYFNLQSIKISIHAQITIIFLQF